LGLLLYLKFHAGWDTLNIYKNNIMRESRTNPRLTENLSEGVGDIDIQMLLEAQSTGYYQYYQSIDGSTVSLVMRNY